MTDQLVHRSVVQATQTCKAVPDQWEGTLIDGRYFYFRYRFGKASLAIDTDPLAVAGRRDVIVRHGDGMRGWFDTDQERARVFDRLLRYHLHGVDPDTMPGCRGCGRPEQFIRDELCQAQLCSAVGGLTR